MLLSNQVKCLKCGDTPFSRHRNDFVYCRCRSIAVDGGMDYSRRVGNITEIEDMSIYVDDSVVDAAKKAIESAIGKKNALGILCAVAITLRDNGYDIIKREL